MMSDLSSNDSPPIPELSEETASPEIAEAESSTENKTEGKPQAKRPFRKLMITLGSICGLLVCTGIALSYALSIPAIETIEDEEIPLSSFSSGATTRGTAANVSTPTDNTTDTPTDSTDAPSANTDAPGGNGANANSSQDTGNTSAGRVWHEAWDESVWVDTSGWIHHEAVWGERTVFGEECVVCEYKIEGSIVPHLQQTGHAQYRTGVIIRYEPYIVLEAWDEWVQSGYWTTVHHEGYWG